MKDFDLIKFTVTDKYYGVPKPYIPEGTVVLLIQDGSVGIRKYEAPTDEDPVPKLCPAKDDIVNEILETDLLNVIRYSYPEYLLQDKAVILICPNDILDKIIW
jgi:hypothetical protein